MQLNILLHLCMEINIKAIYFITFYTVYILSDIFTKSDLVENIK